MASSLSREACSRLGTDSVARHGLCGACATVDAGFQPAVRRRKIVVCFCKIRVFSTVLQVDENFGTVTTELNRTDSAYCLDDLEAPALPGW